MRKNGRVAVPLTDEERRGIEEFFANDLSYEEQAAKMGLTKSQLSYRVKKYREEMKENDKNKRKGD